MNTVLIYEDSFGDVVCICGSRELKPVHDIDIIYTDIGEKLFFVCEGCRRVYEHEHADYPALTIVCEDHSSTQVEDREEYHYYKLKGRALLTISQWSTIKRRVAEI